jgi:hypothetical protein
VLAGTASSGPSKKGQVFNQAEVDFLIIHLRCELDQVDREIVALERMARTQRVAAGRVAKRPIASERAPQGRAGKGWTHHRFRAG